MNWFVVAALVVGIAGFGLPRRLRTSDSARTRVGRPDPAARVVVLIPARNESRNIAGLLRTLPAASSGPLRILVVDDDSTDDTFSCAVSCGAECVHSAALPPGWQGKTWACQQGVDLLADEPGSTVVVLVDSDVRAEPGAIDALLAERARLGGVVSVQPHHVVPTLVEQLSAFFNVVAVTGVGAGTKRPTGLFGPVIAVTLADLRAIGAYQNVAGEVAEDLALADEFQAHGILLAVRVGGAFRFRMYPDGWPALREGWSKNIAGGATAIPLWRALLVGTWVTGLLVATRDFVAAGITGEGWIAASIGYVLAAASLGLLFRRVGTYRILTAVMYPVPLGVFVVIFATSVWATFVRGSVRWKGRAIATDPAAGRRRAKRIQP